MGVPIIVSTLSDNVVGMRLRGVIRFLCRNFDLSKYLSFLKYEFISKEEEFFPLVIRCDKSIDFVSLKELEQGITCLYSFSKEKKGYGGKQNGYQEI